MTTRYCRSRRSNSSKILHLRTDYKRDTFTLARGSIVEAVSSIERKNHSFRKLKTRILLTHAHTFSRLKASRSLSLLSQTKKVLWSKNRSSFFFLHLHLHHLLLLLLLLFAPFIVCLSFASHPRFRRIVSSASKVRRVSLAQDRRNGISRARRRLAFRVYMYVK